MGGCTNCASGSFSFIGAGSGNAASGYVSFVGGGSSNIVSQSYSATLGGLCNNNNGSFSMTWGGGYNGISTGISWGTILGGLYNSVQTNRAGTGGSYLTASTYAYFEFNAIDKVSGSFTITHPDPSKEANWLLYHSFVEAPTAGDNIYRYEVTTCNCLESNTLSPEPKKLHSNS